MTAKVLKLWVCQWRKGAWVAKPFTGHESWDAIDYGEEAVMVAAPDAEAASVIASDRPNTTFPDVLVAG